LKNQLALLAELQAIDSQIDKHENDLAKFPAEAQEIARKLVTVRRELDEAESELKTIQETQKKKEAELATEQEKIKRTEKKLLNIKNQKEYNALTREVKLGKKVEGELEEALLELMNRSEALNKEIEKKTRIRDELESGLDQKRAEAKKAASDAESELTKLNESKAELSKDIKTQYLKRYGTIKQVRGTAIAEVHDGTCNACHMSVPPQLAIKVFKQEELIICPNCQRMLYVREENIPEYNKME
jgi:hypothetical protein